MYAVVGCSSCSALWVVDGRPETTSCPRCGTRHRFERLKRFAETDDAEAARHARAALLAEREGRAEAFAELGSSADLEARAEAAGIDDAAYLEASGVDPNEVTAAGERAERGERSRRSRREIIVDALSELDRPTEEEVIAYAAEHGVPAEYADRALEKLVRRGEVSEQDGRYRPL